MNLEVTLWAQRHNISATALYELGAIWGLHGDRVVPARAVGDSEAAVQSLVRLEAAAKGVKLYRNNVGAYLDKRGIPVRYGLANESKAANAVMKSADLIGYRPVLITPKHLGSVVAQFVSRECKHVGWKYTGGEHERAQLAWAQHITLAGGDACFCTGEGSL